MDSELRPPPVCKLCSLPGDLLIEFHRRLVGAPGDPAATPPTKATEKMTYRALVVWLQEQGHRTYPSQISWHFKTHIAPALKIAAVSGNAQRKGMDRALPLPQPPPRMANIVEDAGIVPEPVGATTTLLDIMVDDLARTYREVNRRVRRTKSMTYAEAGFLTGAVKAVAQAMLAKKAMAPLRPLAGTNDGAIGLMRALTNAHPPALVEGDEPDEEEDGDDQEDAAEADEGAEGLPRDHEGVPDDGFERPIVEAVVAVQEDVEPSGDAAPESSERGPAGVEPPVAAAAAGGAAPVPSWMAR